MVSTAASRSAGSCAAVTWARTRLRCAGTIGGIAGQMWTPRARRRAVSSIVRAGSPTRIGITGVTLRMVSRPAAASPARKARALRHNRSRRSGSRCRIPERRQRRGRACRRQCGREDQRPRAVGDGIDEILVGGDEAADARQRLAHRPDDEVDVVEQVEMLGRSRPAIAEDTPNEWASSTMTKAPWAWATPQMSGSSPMSPSAL